MLEFTEPCLIPKLGRPLKSPELLGPNPHALSRQQRVRRRNKHGRNTYIAVLDMESDPFDNESDREIQPFLAVIYADEFDPIVIWEEDRPTFETLVISAIKSLPNAYTIYAHNGGKFDWMFLIHRIRGKLSFKGRALMKARFGKHEIRDSYHIIPEALSAYRKEKFDYKKMEHRLRSSYRDEIVSYCISDAKYTLQIVKGFIAENGRKLTVGQAAFTRLKVSYPIIQTLGEHLDGKLRGIDTNYYHKDTYGKPNDRGYFYGGRVECLAGKGYFNGPYKLFDVNSMYPFVMASCNHPVGSDYSFRPGLPTSNTCFVHLYCGRNHGALISKMPGQDGEPLMTGNRESGEFFTTIHEYNAALALNLIEDVEVIESVDCDTFSNFADFVLPLYNERQITKSQLKDLSPSDPSYEPIKLKDMCLKFYLNNAYGKFAQNPRKFREHIMTAYNETPDVTDLDQWQVREEWPDHFSLWERKRERWNNEKACYDFKFGQRYRFNNVGTGASITGAARATLLRALCAAIDPIYCDTDSIICRDLGPIINLSATDLGSWKLEAEYDEVILIGKKSYGARNKKRDMIKYKGVSGVTWFQMEKLLAGEILKNVAAAPTISRMGQSYMKRTIKATAPIEPGLLIRRLRNV